jgi:hypothetical protein
MVICLPIFEVRKPYQGEHGYGLEALEESGIFPSDGSDITDVSDGVYSWNRRNVERAGYNSRLYFLVACDVMREKRGANEILRGGAEWRIF